MPSDKADQEALGSEEFQIRYSECAPAITAWASLRLRGPLQSEFSPSDLVQEVACRAYARRDRFDPKLGSFRGWMFGIARHVLLRALEDLASGVNNVQSNWLSTQALHRVPDKATSVTQALLRSEQLALFLEKAGELAEEDRKLLLLRGLEGLAHSDIALQLGIDSKAAAKRWERLRVRLQDAWVNLRLEN